MRIALRVFAGLTILCIVGGVAFLDASGSTGGDMSPFMFPGIGLIGLGLPLALTTAILGIIAGGIRRQIAWLIAMIVVAVIPIIGIPVVETLAGQVDPATSNLLTGTAFGALILGGPILLSLVALVYSFFMRDLAPVAPVPRGAAPFR